MLVKRKHIFELYSELLSNYTWAQLPSFKNNDKISSYHVYLLRIKEINEQQRDAIIEYVSDKEVSVNVHFIPVPMLSYYHNSGYNIKDFPVTYDNYSRVISLPVFYDITDEQIKTVVDVIAESIYMLIKN
jgi:dTDP-4-amino-4,6-dideoxygalactose transaminase